MATDYGYYTKDFIQSRKAKRKPVKVTEVSTDPNKAFLNTVWYKKYSQGGYFTKTSLSTHIANKISNIENSYINPLSKKRIQELFLDFKKLVPGGSILFGMGTDDPVSIANCFVIEPPYDSYGGIMKADQELVQIMKRRGGVGIDISRLRSKGTTLRNAAKTSSGAVSFAKRFSNSTGEVSQEGRRGALLISLSANHKEAQAFIKAKIGNKNIKNANISLRVTKNQVLGNPVLLNTVAEAMHSSAEPGLLFWDQIINESPADCYKDYGYKTVGTNPCGELPLNSYGQCLLLHLNLISYVDKPFTKDAEFKFEELAKDAYDAQRVLDDLVDVELEKIDQIIKKIMLDKEPNEVKLTELNLWRQIRSVMSDGRRTGLGHLGMADVFAAMGMRYASDEAIKLGVEIQKEISINSYKSSIIMAKERGSFSIFNHNKEFDHIFINRILLELDDDGLISDTYAKHGRRNISNLTIAPTGSLAIISEVSAGIEPVYELKYERIVNLGSEKTFTVFHPMFKRWYEINGDKFEFGVKKIEDLNSEEFNTIKDVSPYSGSTTYEINPLAKIKFQGAIQQYIDHSISITHNVKGNTSVKQIKDMINLASKEGCKGFTLFREGSISGILSRIKDDKKAASKFIQKDAIRRPIVLHADVKVTSISGEKFAVVIGLLDNKIYEVFCFKPSNEEIKAFKKPKACFTLSKQESKKYNLSIGPRNSLGGINVQAMIRHIGSKSDPDVEIISRLISISLRHGVDITYIYEQIIKPEASINNAAKAIARMFKSYISNEKISRKKLICPECNVGTLVFAEGCLKCNTCGFSKC